MIKILIIILYSLMSSGGLILTKYGLHYDSSYKIFNFFSINLYTIIGIIMYILSFVIYMYLIFKNNISYIIPMTTATTYIVIFIATIFVIKESFSVLQIIGYFIIMVGVILINI